MRILQYLIGAAALIILTISKLAAQYDTVHYMPPVFVNSDGTEDRLAPGLHGEVQLVISTLSNDYVEVNVTDGNGTVIAYYDGQTSGPKKGEPVTVNLGNTKSSTTHGCVEGDVGGSEDTHTFEPMYKGVVVHASENVMVNMMQVSGKYDGFSLTSKGTTAFGKEFYTGTKISRKTIIYGGRQVITVMATEPGTTTVQFHIKEGLRTKYPWSGKVDSDGIHTVRLEQGQTYVVFAKPTDSYYYNLTDDATSTSTLDSHASTQTDPFSGTKVTSDKNITVVTGGWLIKHPYGSGDSGFDQIVPSSVIGPDYITVRGRVAYDENDPNTGDSNPDRPRAENVNIIATQDGTEVWQKF